MIGQVDGLDGWEKVGRWMGERFASMNFGAYRNDIFLRLESPSTLGLENFFSFFSRKG